MLQVHVADLCISLKFIVGINSSTGYKHWVLHVCGHIFYFIKQMLAFGIEI